MANDQPIRILYTPASLAGGEEEAGAEREHILEQLAEGGGRLDAEAVEKLRYRGWLRQDRWRRGGYLSTYGLREGADHLELKLLNVPSAFAPWAHTLLERTAEQILQSGRTVTPGTVLLLEEPPLEDLAVTFAPIQQAEGRPMLAVVPLP